MLTQLSLVPRHPENLATRLDTTCFTIESLSSDWILKYCTSKDAGLVVVKIQQVRHSAEVEHEIMGLKGGHLCQVELVTWNGLNVGLTILQSTMYYRDVNNGTRWSVWQRTC